MKTMAGDETLNQLKKETIERRLNQRKHKIQTELMKKRLQPAYKMELIHQKNEHPEEQEVKLEEGEKGKPNHTKYHKRGKRKSKKRCWHCKSSDHFKRNCPNLKCFYCHKHGHMKRYCWKWKVNKILNKTIEKKNKKERKKRWKKNKEKEHRRITSIYKHRLKESEFVKKDNKYILKCKDLEIGVFLPKTPPPDLKKLLLRPIPWKKVDVLVKKETKLTKLQLLDNFIHSCVCCPILRKQEFINHINTKHGGMVPPQSQINEPAWITPILFNSDEMEILYCQTSEDLT